MSHIFSESKATGLSFSGLRGDNFDSISLRFVYLLLTHFLTSEDPILYLLLCS